MSELDDDAFQRVGNLFPDAYDLQTLDAATPVSEALDRMASQRFAQMPVLEDGRLLGMFSFWTLTEHLRYEPRPDLNRLVVGDLIEAVPTVTVDDDLYRVLELLRQHEALLVGTSTDLQAITTAWDVLQYFWTVARPYLLLREIELALRAIIDDCLGRKGELERAVDVTVGKMYKSQGRVIPERLAEMTFSDYVSLVGSSANWEHFEGVLGFNRDLINTRLGLVNDIRNRVFHFKDADEAVSVRDYETLVAERERLLKATGRLTRKLAP